MKLLIKALSATLALTGFATSTAVAQNSADLLLPPANYSRSAVSANNNSPVIGSKVEGIDPTDAAFQEALKSIAPLTPDQIKEMRRRLDGVEQATGSPLSPINPITRSVSLSLKSGERPASIKVSPGWISTITFSDVTGQPWPVMNVVNGNPDAYVIQSAGKDNTSNIITITAKQAYIPSNIAVTLVGAKVPILMTLNPNVGEVDFRVDAQMDQRGPYAEYDTVIGDTLAPTNDSVMLSFLDGVPPEGAKKLKVGDREVQAWRYDEMLYIRTSKSLMAPAYISKQHNASGVYVFVLKEAPVLLMSDAGRTQYVRIER